MDLIENLIETNKEITKIVVKIKIEKREKEKNNGNKQKHTINLKNVMNIVHKKFN